VSDWPEGFKQCDGSQGESVDVREGLSGKVFPVLVSMWTKLSLPTVGILSGAVEEGVDGLAPLGRLPVFCFNGGFYLLSLLYTMRNTPCLSLLLTVRTFKRAKIVCF